MPKSPAELTSEELRLARVEEAWRDEIHRRLSGIDSGAVKLIPWQDAQRRLWTPSHR